MYVSAEMISTVISRLVALVSRILDLLNQLILGQGSLDCLYLVSLSPEQVLPDLVDVLQQQNFDVARIEWFEGLQSSSRRLSA